MTREEEENFALQVRQLHPDIIWIGLGTPKQERFMFQYLPMLDAKLMVGVGAAFLFHTGEIKDSPQWVKRAGLQWLHRLVQEPTRLWRRYLLNVPAFLLQASLQVAGLHHSPLKIGPNQLQPTSSHEGGIAYGCDLQSTELSQSQREPCIYE